MAGAPGAAATARTAIVTVDDDPGVSRAVARDLRRRYGESHRIVRAESGETALDALQGAEAARRPGRRDPGRLPDASDERHRVPRAAMDVYPGARRVLLTAYADTRRRSRRSTSSISTTTCSSRGTRPRRSSTRSWTPCWRPGWRRITGRCRRPSWSGTAGRRARPRSASSSPATGAVPLVRLRRAGRPAAAGGGRRGRAHPAGRDHGRRRGAGRARRCRASRPGWPGDHAVARTSTT
jgi:hypothetical protein